MTPHLPHTAFLIYRSQLMPVVLTPLGSPE